MTYSMNVCPARSESELQTNSSYGANSCRDLLLPWKDLFAKFGRLFSAQCALHRVLCPASEVQSSNVSADPGFAFVVYKWTEKSLSPLYIICFSCFLKNEFSEQETLPNPKDKYHDTRLLGYHGLSRTIIEHHDHSLIYFGKCCFPFAEFGGPYFRRLLDFLVSSKEPFGRAIRSGANRKATSSAGFRHSKELGTREPLQASPGFRNRYVSWKQTESRFSKT